MIDYKKEIAKSISKITNISENELENYIEIPPNSEMGDFAFPCFKLAKELRKAPPLIANEIKEKIETDSIIERVEVVGGYLNFFINKVDFSKQIIKKVFDEKEMYGSSKIGNEKTVIVEYSSPNIAKPMHIGHLRNTVLGSSIYKIYKFLGYDVVGMNFLGDWGINFAKIMAGYSMWKDEYTFTEDSLEPIVKIYVRYNQLEKEDETYTQLARQWHIKLESGDEEALRLWNWLRDISIKEAEKVYKILDCKFESYEGEAFFNDKMDAIIQELRDKNLLVESQGAQVVDLSEYNMPPCIILTSSGTTLYVTRDLASLKYRAQKYKFDKALYVVGSEQQLHFKQLFKVFEMMGYTDYAKNCEHIYYGMILDSTGKKMGTRKGTSLTLMGLLEEGVSKASQVLEQKNTTIENKEELAKTIGVGAIIFNTLFNTKVKDIIFDWDNVLNFNGETGPYVQYVYVRTRSILRKAEYVPNIEEVDFSKLQEKEALEVIKLLGNFPEIIKLAADKYEPSVIARYLIDLAQGFSSFYNEHHIICDDKQIQDARLALTNSVSIVIKTGLKLLGIDCPERM